jgi:hypothetical protein
VPGSCVNIETLLRGSGRLSCVGGRRWRRGELGAEVILEKAPGRERVGVLAFGGDRILRNEEKAKDHTGFNDVVAQDHRDGLPIRKGCLARFGLISSWVVPNCVLRSRRSGMTMRAMVGPIRFGMSCLALRPRGSFW